MTAANIVWAALLAVGLLYELYTLANDDPGDTLSERIRAWFAVHTRPGRAVFLVVWLSFAAWFAAHITAEKLLSDNRPHTRRTPRARVRVRIPGRPVPQRKEGPRVGE